MSAVLLLHQGEEFVLLLPALLLGAATFLFSRLGKDEQARAESTADDQGQAQEPASGPVEREIVPESEAPELVPAGSEPPAHQALLHGGPLNRHCPGG